MTLAGSSHQTVYDVIVVGAGAAGLMTAIMCRRNGLKVLLLDSQKKIGAKILMSGGTRCNVTNFKVTTEDFNSEELRTIRNVLNAFPADRTLDFFQKLGVNFVLEPGGKYFPTTHSGKTILEALLREVERLGIDMLIEHKVRRIENKKSCFMVGGSCFVEGFNEPRTPNHETSFQIKSKTAVLCTGGLSYPATGSDGIGYTVARGLGHQLVPTNPALTPLECDDTDFKALSGVSLPCRLTLLADDKKDVSFEEPLLFTHFGYSGPGVLNISRHWILLKENHKVELCSNFLPGETEEGFRKKLQTAGKNHPQKTLRKFLADYWPERFAETFLKKSGLQDPLTLNQLNREDREKLIRLAFHWVLPVTKAYGYGKAEVTAGGINLKDVDSRTLESKLQPGLFFAGEIVDVDGRIGGFNFQWAWSSGYVVALALKQRLENNP